MNNSKHLLALAISAALAAPMAAHATNGMNLEAYGAVAGGMGGASMAYDNGTAAMMNNPATLGLAEDGNRIDVAVGRMAPDITASSPMGSADSKATSFIMPAIGWAKKDGKMTYGVGMFSQGGMGTEYGGDTFLAAGTGRDVMSEVGVGRIIFPLAYTVNDELVVGGSIDYVWGGMDLRMAIDATTFGNMMLGGLIDTNMTIPGGWSAARFDFEEGGSMAQATKGNGYAGKLGMTYKVNDKLTMGASYHAKTAMADFKGDATMAMYSGTANIMEMSGTMIIEDFQMPASMALGIEFQASEKMRIVADVKQYLWADAMKNFNMRFETGGQYIAITMPQNWEDQTVISLGGEFQASDKLKVRAGANLSSNPIPDSTMNPMFPAIIENNYTLGVGYDVSGHQAVDFSLTMAPEVSQTNSAGVMPVTVTHSQMNMQVTYSHKF
ncbi:MAG: outer membrane protein transport protein [Pseudomonadota bacterium]